MKIIKANTVSAGNVSAKATALPMN